VSAPLVRGRALARRRLLGVAFLGVLAVLVSATVLQYRKAFTPVVHVTLEADRAGNQLTKGADVKVRGLLIGQVRSVRSVGEGARLELALDPEQTRLLPKTVTAQLLPKTLFGEKFVALDLPTAAGSGHLAQGDVISQNRTSTALETEKAIDDLLPLLKSLQPQDLSVTLNALSTALRGRGDQLGANLQRTAAYLARLNPQLVTLRSDFAGLADFADNAAAATPALLQVLDNLSFSSRSLVQQQNQLDTFLSATTGFAASARDLVAANEQRLVSLAAHSVPVLATYAKEAPGYPCLLASVAAQEPVIERSFGGLQPGLHITMEPTQDNGGYTTGQTPVYADPGGTFCYGLDPQHPIRPITAYYNPYDGYYDGQEIDPYTGRPPCTHSPCAKPPRRQDTAGGTAERSALRAAAGPALGLPADQVPDLATVLLAPLARGATIDLS
jgi:phospholipid/cholesterol/gamma-HCH transport system substrate-binding protein